MNGQWGLYERGIMPNLSWLQKWTEVVSSSTTVSELCKKLVHSEINTGQGIGSYLYLLDNKGQIVQLGGYGVNPLPADQVFSNWEDNLLAKSINANGLSHQEADHQGSKLHLYAIPMLKGGTPLGSAMFCQRDKMPEFPKEANLAMGQVLGLWLSSTGLVNGFSSNENNGDGSPDSLTARQLKILESMSLGKTNAEIAQVLILSESSIRQETVKIYRALGVGSRAEAVKRAIHLGLLNAKVG